MTKQSSTDIASSSTRLEDGCHASLIKNKHEKGLDRGGFARVAEGFGATPNKALAMTEQALEAGLKKRKEP